MPFPNAALDQPINAEMDHRETGADMPETRARPQITHSLVCRIMVSSQGKRFRAPSTFPGSERFPKKGLTNIRISIF